MFEKIKSIAEFIYFLSGISLTATVVIGLIQLRYLKKDIQDKNLRSSREKSLEMLVFYAEQFLPELSNYDKIVRNEIEKPYDSSKYFNESFLVNIHSLPTDLIAQTVIKEEKGLVHLLNKLEFFSVSVLSGVADEEVLFTPIAKTFCEFIKKEHIYISYLRTSGAPYINLIKLYKKWNSKIKVEQAKLEKVNAENRLNELGDNHDFQKPIGF